MPTLDSIAPLNLSGKALVLYTANLESNGYGNDVYAKTRTVLKSDVLDQILSKSPAFIVIDSYGIGGHGGEHQMFDKRCEQYGCFVIENITLTRPVAEQLAQLDITIDKTSQSSGKRVDVKGILKH
ncbi:methyltransferase domain protein [Elysia marginata]|uniref:Methyltransferase domain protein n=1 Tax=Elysia marginata TaxID=1093978 RepID=A0AAV4HWF5_9GAST|nr:methyltransferase domain protein [Elysia marginata]